MRLFYICIICLLVSAQAFGQKTFTISGEVTSNGEPLSFASVGLSGTPKGTTTKEDGTFILKNVKSGSYKLIISMVGFESVEKDVTVNSNLNLGVLSTNETSIGLEEVVVVSGTMQEISKMDSPVPVEVFRPSFFRMNPTSNVFEGLQNINGVRPQLNCNVCNTGDIHINGLEGPYTMVLLDGMPIVSGLSTVYGLSGIPNSLIERMEVVKGSASALYGSEAVGGIINIITKDARNAPAVSLDVFGTTWQELNTDIGLKLNLNENVSSLTGINYFNYQNPIDNNGDGFTDLTLQHRISVFNKWNFKLNDHKSASIAGRYFYEDRWGGEMNWNESFRGGNEVYGESIYTERFEIIGTYPLPTKEDITIFASYNQHDQNSVYGDLRYIADQKIGFTQLLWNKPLGAHSLLSGLTYRYTFYDDDTPATANEAGNAPGHVHLPGFFVQDNWTLNEKHSVLLGGRYDYDNRHGNILSPRFAYKWKPNGQNTLRVNFGTGFRVVNLFTEDHAALTGARDVIIEEELKPEQSFNGSINYVNQLPIGQSIITFDVSGWYTYFTNKIIPDYDTDPNLIIYDNLDGSAVSRGISLNTNFVSYSPFRANVGVTIMDVSNTERGDDGKLFKSRQILTERFMGTWTLSYSWYKLGLSIDYTGNIYGSMRLPILGELDPREEFSPVWSIQNIQFTKKLGPSWEVYGGVKNLLNFTPPRNSIARSHDPFDENVRFYDPIADGPRDAIAPGLLQGDVWVTEDNPNALTFDPSYVYAPNQGIRGFIGFRYTLQ